MAIVLCVAKFFTLLCLFCVSAVLVQYSTVNVMCMLIDS